MKKRAVSTWVVTILLVLLLFVSCSAPATPAAANPGDTAEKFLRAMFTFEDFNITDASGLPDEQKLQKQMNDKFGAYATPDLIHTLIMNRMPDEFVLLATQSKCHVTPGAVNLSTTNEDKDMTSYIFTVNLSLAFDGKQGNAQMSVSGQMNVKAQNGGFRVSDFSMSGKDLYNKLQEGQ